jgi:prepilin-type N-terminal cleavage/methylation domain-containing protein
MSAKKKIRSFRNIKGFTLLELILSMVVLAAIFGITAQTMIMSSENLSYIENRKTAVADIRYGINRFTQELRQVESDDIRNISSTSIEFVDQNANAVTYQLAADGSRLSIYRDDDALIPNVASFNLRYLDAAGNDLGADSLLIADIRRIQLTITTDPIGDEEAMTFSTTVVPRSFVGYTNYEQ